MSRDEIHGGEGWSYRTCLWSPTKKKKGRGGWPFWSKVLAVKEGDTVFHLRGKGKEAVFEGYSFALDDGYETAERPPLPGQWDYSDSFYRTNLIGFLPFAQPIRLADVFSQRRTELENYFDKNRSPTGAHKNIFFVRQAGRLQCLNGAYLSEIDEGLFAALFGIDFQVKASIAPSFVSVPTGEQLSKISIRVGQAAFSREIRALYGSTCCFPTCQVIDSRFLVASHIARWSDDKQLRGELGNGLCLCLMHDKAFEIGLFTLSDDFRVLVNPAAFEDSLSGMLHLAEAQGQKIRVQKIKPLAAALKQHRDRIKFDEGNWFFPHAPASVVAMVQEDD